MRNSLIDLVINYLLDAKNFQQQFTDRDENSKEYCKEMDWLINKLKKLKSEISEGRND